MSVFMQFAPVHLANGRTWSTEHETLLTTVCGRSSATHPASANWSKANAC